MREAGREEPSRGVCEVCESAAAEHRCRMCGREVCSRHFASESGLCAVCANLLCSFCRSSLSTSYCLVCGKLGCSDCLVQVDPVRYVCRECFARYGRDYKRCLQERVKEARRFFEELRRKICF